MSGQKNQNIRYENKNWMDVYCLDLKYSPVSFKNLLIDIFATIFHWSWPWNQKDKYFVRYVNCSKSLNGLHLLYISLIIKYKHVSKISSCGLAPPWKLYSQVTF